MQRLFGIKPALALGIYAVLDILCIGMGMGVPIFCIALGFAVGWYVIRASSSSGLGLPDVLKRCFLYASATSGFTFLGMAAIWGRCLPMLFDPTADLANFGIPMILYEPVASFIGWLVLMVLISPFLQLLTTLFGSHLTLLLELSKHAGNR